MLKPVEKQRVAEEIVDQLRELILTGQYPPGAKLPPERELAKRLGVNRASLREALKKLEHLGLVRIRQGDGTRVQNFMETGGIELVSHLLPLATTTHPGIIRDMLEFRRIFGREAARLAAGRATAAQLDAMRAMAAKAVDGISLADLFELDFEFYVVMTAGTGNRVMGLLINTVRDAVKSYTPVLMHLIAPVADVRAHHEELIDAIASGDGERAARITDEYLESGAQRVLTLMDSGKLPATDGSDANAGSATESSASETGQGGAEPATSAEPATPGGDKGVLGSF